MTLRPTFRIAALMIVFTMAAWTADAQSASFSGDSAVETVQKSPSATTRVKLHDGDFAVWIDSSKWQPAPSLRPEWLELRWTAGGGVARVITDARRVPTIAVVGSAINNLKAIDPNIKITLQEKRTSNGHTVVALRADGTMNAVPTTFFSYIYGGTSGNVQSLTVMPTVVFRQAAGLLQEFLDGIEISDQEIGNAADPGPDPKAAAPICQRADIAVQPTTYNFSRATLSSFRYALTGETAYRVSALEATRSLTGGKPPDAQPVSLIGTSTQYFACAKQPLRTFLYRPTPEGLWTIAYGLTAFYDKRLDLNGRMLNVFSKVKTWPEPMSKTLGPEAVNAMKTQLDVVGEITTVDTDELQPLEVFSQAIRSASASLLNVNDKERLVVTRAEKQALLDRITELFPESASPTKNVQDGRGIMIKLVDLYVTVLNLRKGADE